MANRLEPLTSRLEGQKVRCNPTTLTEIELSPREREILERESLSIFTECCNAGLPLREALTAIMLTGVDWGVTCTKKLYKDRQ